MKKLLIIIALILFQYSTFTDFFDLMFLCKYQMKLIISGYLQTPLEGLRIIIQSLTLLTNDDQLYSKMVHIIIHHCHCNGKNSNCQDEDESFL